MDEHDWLNEGTPVTDPFASSQSALPSWALLVRLCDPRHCLSNSMISETARSQEKLPYHSRGSILTRNDVVPDIFEATGEAVLDRILEPVHDGSLGVPRRRSVDTSTDIPHFLGALSPGGFFKGEQNASGTESKTYPVNVELKDVDISDSFLCGYLTIEHLTETCPTLTTFFEGEIIGPKYNFATNKWLADLEVDQRHWEKFPYFRAHCQSYLYSPASAPYDFLSHDVIFMRWKEHFLVPDHHVRTITGASYEGFYYVAYDQRDACVEGYYYHQKSADFQRLLLAHVPSKVSAAFEFR